MKETTAILDNIYPLVEQGLSKNMNKYTNMLSKFLSDRHTELSDNAPYSRIYYRAEDEDLFFKCLGLNKKEIQSHLQKTYYADIAKFNPAYAKDPLTVCALMCIRYFLLKKDTRKIKASIVYFAFSGKFYPSIHYGCYKKFQPIEYRHVMEYVVNNELSQKFILKREGTILKTIESISNTWLESYNDRFEECSDEDVVYLVQQLHTRILSFMWNIAVIYMQAYDDKDKWLTYNSDNYSDDNFRIDENDSMKAEKAVQTALNYITTSSANIKYCKMAADSNVRSDELLSIVQSIQNNSENMKRLNELFSILVHEFFAENKKIKEVTGIEFISFCIAAKPNTKNPNIIRMKEIVEELLEENSMNYRRRRSRIPTKNSYNRAILSYYAILINQTNK